MSTIEPLRDDWGAKAAAGDALDRVPNEAPFVGVWIDPQRGIQWSKANTDFQSLSMLSMVMHEFSVRCVREELDK